MGPSLLCKLPWLPDNSSLPGFLAVTKAPGRGLRMPGSTYSQDTIEDEKRAAQRTSIQLFYACIAGFVGGVFWLIAFASPYWLSSWEDTQSPFSNMGLWEFCFDHFRYPKFQFDRVFTGCAMTWGDEYRLVREWLMPWWLILVQLFAGIAFIVSFSSQIIDVWLLLLGQGLAPLPQLPLRVMELRYGRLCHAHPRRRRLPHVPRDGVCERPEGGEPGAADADVPHCRL